MRNDRRNGYGRSLRSTAGILIYVLGGGALGFFCSIFVCMWLESTYGDNPVTEFLFFLIMASFSLAPCIHLMLRYFDKGISKKKQKIKAYKYRSAPKNQEAAGVKFDNIAEYEKFPHFGEAFGYDRVEKMIEKENFDNYCFKDGKKSKHIHISESEKWVCILGGFIPLDLICGYSRANNTLFTIDGVVINLPAKAGFPWVAREIEKFFDERGQYFKEMPRDATLSYMFRNVAAERALYKADWSKYRYEREKKIVNNGNYVEGSDEFFERIMPDDEIDNMVLVIKKGLVDLNKLLDFDKYSNEFSVCNCIEVLKKLGYARNKDGLDFLFECLRDVDEAYFHPAIEVIRQFPRTDREAKIEQEVQKAYESRDALRLAGLLYLAKELDYEIQFVKDLKDEMDEADKENLVMPAGME